MPCRMKIHIITPLLLLLVLSGQPCFASQKPVVYFGINLRYTPRTMYLRYQPLMDYLTGNTPYRFELRINRGYREALEDLVQGRVSISSLGDGAFVEALLLHGAIPLVKPLNAEGKPFYRAAIIVPRDSSVRDLKELKGKTFAFGSYHSVTGNLLPRCMLDQAGVPIRELGGTAGLKNHDAVTKAILKGRYGAGAVKDLFAAKYQQYGLRVLAYSGPVASVPLVVRRDAPKELKASVSAALLKLDPRNPEHRRIMASWDEEFRHGFAAASIDDYREQMRLFGSIPFGCGAGCHR